jgi:hypothetical protein
VTAIAAAGLATFAATGFGDQGATGASAQPTVIDDVEMKTIRTETLSGAEANARGVTAASGAKASRRTKLKLTYLAGGAIPVNPNDGVLIELDCPSGKQAPFSGGIQNQFLALVEINSSSSPPIGADAADWYEGVSNINSSGPALSFRPTLVCAKLK